eukprot:TRINITY_DN53545_c0_g1_i1.p1 TRINITY_DN53545_c0_g1~~TRINITY_DN53545_c0_g1_i1.p1  ORF type:complete len:141 (-),score=22.68 TRINITY_DN53545_c0_g1_i1:18-440(-)
MHFFFFKQKTAYEMLRSLVGSEMCIRDRFNGRSMNSSLRTHELTRLSVSRSHCMPPSQSDGAQAASRAARASPSKNHDARSQTEPPAVRGPAAAHGSGYQPNCSGLPGCLLYTSDAADEEDSVDLGGRRYMKKQKRIIND